MSEKQVFRMFPANASEISDVSSAIIAQAEEKGIVVKVLTNDNGDRYEQSLYLSKAAFKGLFNLMDDFYHKLR